MHSLRLRFRVGDLVRLLAAWASSTLGLLVAAAVLPHLAASTLWAYVAVAAVAAPVGLVLRPAVVEMSARLGWLAVVPLALVGEAVIMYAAILIVPGITSTFWSAVAASWIAAMLGTLIAWLTTAGTDDGLTRSLLRRGRRRAVVDDPDVDGVLFVQFDGLPYPVLHWAVQAGAVTTIRRWLATGEYSLREWTAQLPCTTPASQLGILHGTIDGVPAFRWYDRDLGRVLVANRPADARVIEERASDGHGLLYDDGVSISNLFTGDAPRAMMTMSRIGVARGSTETRRMVAWFLTTPAGFSRSLTRTVAEIAKERWQARRQRVRDLDPRVHRGWTFAVLRAATNALQRDLNTALVAEEMRRGTRSIYVDYVDYDEIAHHAGMFRPESLAALEGVDRVLGTLEALARSGARRYRIVVLSDHGQSQGKSFRDRHGHDLATLCETLMAEPVRSVEQPVEGWGRAGAMVGDVGHGEGGGVTGHALDRIEAEVGSPDEDTADLRPVVLASGNLGLLYVPGQQRWSLDDLSQRWPGLVRRLAEQESIGFVAGLDRGGVAWAIGADGRRNLVDGTVTGADPLRAFAPHAPRALLRALSMSSAPDLYVNSTVEEATLDVAAFEDLVGAHGGFGGWQDRAVLLVPRDLSDAVPPSIEDAVQLHRALVAILRSCGHRTVDPPVPAPAVHD